MGKSQRIRHEDVREVYRIASDVREVRYDPAAMHARLIDGLLGLVGGTCGFACEVADWRPGGDLRIAGLTSDSTSDGAVAELIRGLAEANSLWDDPSFVEGVRQAGLVESVPFHRLVPDQQFRRCYPLFYDIKRDVRHADHLIAWHRIGPQRRDIRAVSIHRWGKGQRRFGRRETEVARALFEELNWLYTTGRFDPPVPGLAGLPPRLAEVLDLLRAGQAPKQIAQRLGLSVHTVRDHVKRLYARAGVGDRGALMALLSGGGRRTGAPQ
jgi:DNA-binding CsgD family transcriptional regulator